MSARLDIARAHAEGRYPQSEVDLTALREAFTASGLRPCDVARSLDWYAKGRADGPRVKRALGLRPYTDRTGKRVRRRCSYKRAVELALAIGVDPVEVGL